MYIGLRIPDASLNNRT